MDRQVIEAHAYRAVFDDAIAERLRWRRWYRARAWTIGWASREDNETILRELVKLARKARDLAGPARGLVFDPDGTVVPDDFTGDHFAGMPA